MKCLYTNLIDLYRVELYISALGLTIIGPYSRGNIPPEASDKKSSTPPFAPKSSDRGHPPPHSIDIVPTFALFLTLRLSLVYCRYR